MKKTGAAADKAVVKKEAAQLPASVAAYDYGEDAGLGTEQLGREDYAIPFLYLLQPLSPVITQGTLPDAKPGMIMNTVNQELFPAAETTTGVLFIPCYKEHLYGEWRPRNAGGGFVKDHAVDSEIVRELKSKQGFGKLTTGDGNELIETFYVYGLLVKDDETEPAVIAFTSTKIKIYKQWMTRIGTMKVPTPAGGKIAPPMWAHVWRFNSVLQRKDQNVWHNFKITFRGANADESRLAPSDPIYQAGKELYESCKAGGIRVATESLAAATGGASGDGSEEEAPPF